MSRSTENRGTGARPNGERKLVVVPTHKLHGKLGKVFCISIVSQTHCRLRHLQTNRMSFAIENVPKSTPDLQYFSPFVHWALGPIRRRMATLGIEIPEKVLQ